MLQSRKGLKTAILKKINQGVGCSISFEQKRRSTALEAEYIHQKWQPVDSTENLIGHIANWELKSYNLIPISVSFNQPYLNWSSGRTEM